MRLHREHVCSTCAAPLAHAGEYATICTPEHAIVLFDTVDRPKNLAVALECANGHNTAPEGCSLEWWFTTPPETKAAVAHAVTRVP